MLRRAIQIHVYKSYFYFTLRVWPRATKTEISATLCDVAQDRLIVITMKHPRALSGSKMYLHILHTCHLLVLVSLDIIYLIAKIILRCTAHLLMHAYA